MKLHYLQHVPFEGPANIETWAREQGFAISGTKLYEGAPLPKIEALDWLVVMGGPMNIYEEEKYPWLVAEKEFIREAIQSGKTVLGVCLGAQLISDVLGGKVFRNECKEIGWYPVSLTPEARKSPVFGSIPARFIAFHWHGDTFPLPPGSVHLAASQGCALQAFEYDEGRVVGLQFHLESSAESVGLLIRNCRDELVDGQYIQTPDEMLSAKDHFEAIHGLLRQVLDNMRKRSS